MANCQLMVIIYFIFISSNFRYGKDKMSDLDAVKQDVSQLWKNHERNAAAVKEIRAALEKMLGIAGHKGASGTVLNNQPGFGGSSFA